MNESTAINLALTVQSVATFVQMLSAIGSLCVEESLCPMQCCGCAAMIANSQHIVMRPALTVFDLMCPTKPYVMHQYSEQKTT